MLKDLNADQTKLAGLMSLISEKGYYAGWMQNLEFELWGALNGGDKKFGHYVITQGDIDELSSLSKKCGCWIVFDDKTEETAIDLDTWNRKMSSMFAK